MNLFDMNENTRQLPLASRMRPEKQMLYILFCAL